jgi:O-succinylbenzoic acid--CoA ligase
MMTLLPDWLTRAAQNYPDKLALRCEGTDWSFAELDRQATRLARGLAAQGVRAGDRVALLAQNGLPFAALVHALTRLGAVLVPLNTRLTPAELAWQLADVRAAWLLADTHYADLVREIRTRHEGYEGAEEREGNEGNEGAEVLETSGAHAPFPSPGTVLETAFSDPFVLFATFASFVSRPASQDVILRTEIDLDAPQAIIYTSGTTGQPKGAIITYGMQWWGAVGSALNLGHDPADRWLACTPFFHVSGLSILFRSVIYGIGVVVHERFDAAAINRSIRGDGVTIISVVAVMVQRMLDDLGADQYPPALRCLLLGGGPAPLPLLQACAHRNIPVVQTYGMTESCAQAVTLAPADALRKLGSAGKPLAAVELRIVDNNGQRVPNGVPGEIELRGPTITPGYAERPDATARAFNAAGWFATGDLGYLDAEGYLFVLDRRADLIISGGENVYPAEIEAALLAHPTVAEAGAFGQPDARWGQVPIALVRLHDGAAITPDALLLFLADRLAHYKLPHAIHIVPTPLPRNAAGKLLRRDLPALLSSDNR